METIAIISLFTAAGVIGYLVCELRIIRKCQEDLTHERTNLDSATSKLSGVHNSLVDRINAMQEQINVLEMKTGAAPRMPKPPMAPFKMPPGI